MDPRRSKFRFVVRVVTLVCCVSNVGLPELAQATIWQERQQARLAMRSPSIPPMLPSLEKARSSIWNPSQYSRYHGELRTTLNALPVNLITVRDIKPAERPNAPVLVFVQDVHENFEAQQNIQRLLSNLNASVRPRMVAVEAAFGPLNLRSLCSFPDLTALRSVSEAMLAEKKIAGPLAAALASNPALALIGVDDPHYYRANVAAYLHARGEQPQLRARLANWDQQLQQQKQTLFNEHLLAFDRDVAHYHSDGSNLGDYAELLAANTNHISPSVELFLQAVRAERSLDFARVESERSRLVAALIPKLSATSAAELASLTSAFRAGAIDHAQFYSSLEKIVTGVGLSLRAYPAMSAYVRYVMSAESIQSERLLRDLNAMENAAYARLATTAEEKQLVRESQQLRLTRRLAEFSLTKDEWGAYQQQKTMSASADVRGQDLTAFEMFYRVAEARDRAMVTNFLKFEEADVEAPPSLPIETAWGGIKPKIREKKLSTDFPPHVFSVGRPGGANKISILIAGGFHTDGITTAAHNAGFSVITVAPKLTHVDTASGSEYLSVFAQQKTPLEKLITGQPLFLAKPVLNRATVVELALRASAMSAKNVRAWLVPFLRTWGGLRISQIDKMGAQLQISGGHNTDAFEVIANQSHILSAGVIRPVFENIVLSWVRPMAVVLAQTYVPAAFMPWSNVIVNVVIAAVFSALHFRREGFGWRFAMGYVYVYFLDVVGFNWSTAVHVAHNMAILGAALHVLRGSENTYWRALASTPLTWVPLTVKGTNIFDRPALERSFVFSDRIREEELHSEKRLWDINAEPTDDVKSLLVEKEMSRFFETMMAIKAVADSNLIGDGGMEEDANVQWLSLAFNVGMFLNSPKNKTEYKTKIESGLTAAAVAFEAGNKILETAQDIKAADMRGKKEELGNAGLWAALTISETVISEQNESWQGLTDQERIARIGEIYKRLREKRNPLKDVKSRVVLVVKNPDNTQMERMVAESPEKLAVIVIVGKMSLAHWAAVLAKRAKIPVVAVDEDIPHGIPVFVDAINEEVYVDISVDERKHLQNLLLERDALQVAMDGLVNAKDWAGRQLTGVLEKFPEGSVIDLIKHFFNGAIGLFRTEFLVADKEPPTNRGEFFESLGRQLLALFQNLTGVISIRAFDLKPASNDKNSWLVTVNDKTKEGLQFLLNAVNGPQAFKDLVEQVLIANHRFLAGKRRNRKRGPEFFIPDVRTVEDLTRILALYDEAFASAKAKVGSKITNIPFGVMIEADLGKDQIRRILSNKRVAFVSIGTRDMSVNLRDATPLDARYRRAIRNVIEVAAELNLPVKICGMFASEENLITDIFSMKLPESAQPKFSVIDSEVARVQAFLRALAAVGVDNFDPDIQSSDADVATAALKKTTKLIREKRRDMLRSEKSYRETRYLQAVQAGPKTQIKAQFDKYTTGPLWLTDVDVEGPENEQITFDEAGTLAFDFSFMLPIARMACASLKYKGNHPFVRFLARMSQNVFDRGTMLADLRRQFLVAHVGGRLEAFGLLTPGAIGGLGDDIISLIAPSSTVSRYDQSVRSLTRVYAQGRMPIVPAGYVLTIEASDKFSREDLESIIRAGRQIGKDSLDLRAINREAKKIADTKTWANERSPHILFAAADYLSDDETLDSLAIGKTKGFDLTIRVQRMSTAAVSAAVRSHLGGEIAAVPVPGYGHDSFSVEEKANLIRFKIDPEKIWTKHELLPIEKSDDIAVVVAVLKPIKKAPWMFSPSSENGEIPGPSVDDKGNITIHLLWLSRGQVKVFRLIFKTNISDLQAELKTLEEKIASAQTSGESIDGLLKQQSQVAANLVLAWAEAGESDRASAVYNQQVIKNPDDMSKPHWGVVRLLMSVTSKIGVLHEDVADALRMLSLASAHLRRVLRVIPTPEGFGAGWELQNVFRWCLSVLAREKLADAYKGDLAPQRKQLNDVYRHVNEILAFSDAGFDTVMMGNRMELKPLVDEYELWEANKTVEKKNEPILSIRLGEAVTLYFQYRDAGRLSAEVLQKPGYGLLSVLLATALANEPLDTKARLINCLLLDPNLLPGEKRPENIRKFTAELIASLLKVQRAAPNWLPPLPRISVDQVMNRALLEKVIDQIQALPQAPNVLLELVRVANAKAQILPALAASAFRKRYLHEAMAIIDAMLSHHKTLDQNLVPVLRVFSSVATQYALLTDDPEDNAKAHQLRLYLNDNEAFVAFASSLKYEGAPVFSAERINQMNAGRKKSALEHGVHLKSLGITEAPIINSVPAWIAVALGRNDFVRWVRPGYIAEILIAVTLVILTSFVPWLSSAAFVVSGSSVSYLTTIFLVWIAAHPLLWLVVELRDDAPRRGWWASLLSGFAAQLVWHLILLSPYVVAAHLASDPAISRSLVAVWTLGAMVLQIVTDEWAMWRARASFTPEQKKFYDEILSSLAMPEPTAADRLSLGVAWKMKARGVESNLTFMREFQSATHAALTSSTDVLEDAAELKSDHFSFGYWTDKPGDQAAIAARVRKIQSAPMVVVFRKGMSLDTCAEVIRSLRNMNPRATIVSVRIGDGYMTLRDGTYSYEDLFKTFSQISELSTYKDDLLELVAGRRVSFRPVQVNAPPVFFEGSIELLRSILYLLPTLDATHGVMIDLQSLQASANDA